MTVTLPHLVTGIIDGDENAWSLACTLLGSYYQPEGGLRSSFDLLHSGDPYSDDALLSGADFVALGALGYRVSVSQSRQILADDRVRDLVSQIPTHLDLVDADEHVIGPDSPAHALYTLLAGPEGYDLGWKVAEALLARLRPALFPVVTGTERKTLGLTKHMPTAWYELRETLRSADARLAYQLYYLIQTAPVWNELTQVQVLMALVYTDALSSGALASPAAGKKTKKAAKQARKLKAAQARHRAQPATVTSDDAADGISTAAFRLRDHQ